MRKYVFAFLILYIFSLPWQAYVFIPGIGSISRVFGLILIGVTVFYILFKKNLKELPLLIIIAGIYISFGLLSYFWSVNQQSTISRFITNIQLLAMLWLIWEICDSKADYKKLIQFFILGLFVAIFDMLSTYFSMSYGHYRITAGGFNANRIAVYLSFGIPLAWYLLLVQNKVMYTWINSIYIPLAIFCIVLTGSRTGFVVAITGSLLIPITYLFLKSNQRLVIGSILGISVLLTMIFLSGAPDRLDRNIERITGTSQSIQEGQFSSREVYWKAGMNRLSERPLFGYGARGSRFVIGGEIGRAEFSAHSTYIGVLVDLGMIGMLFFLSMFLIALIPNITLNYLDVLFHLVMIATILIAMIPSSLEVDKVVWFILSICLGNSFLLFKNSAFYIIQRNND